MVLFVGLVMFSNAWHGATIRVMADRNIDKTPPMPNPFPSLDEADDPAECTCLATTMARAVEGSEK